MIKRGQVTIFIILAIVIVSAVIIFLLIRPPKFISDQGQQLELESCVEDITEKAIKDLGVNGGFVKPEFTYSYLGEKIPYLCYTNNYYESCVVQKPFLKQHFEGQLEGYLKEEIEKCYSNSIDDLKSKGYDVVAGSLKYEILLEPNIVRVNILAPTSVGSNTQKEFDVKIGSSLYEMLMISTSILQYETKLGDSDVSSLMNLYPDFIIDKIKQGEGTTIYILEDKIHGNKFKFASRSFAWPAGYDI